MINKIGKLLFDKDYRWFALACRGVFNSWSDERYLKKCYAVRMKKELNLNNPQTFNEKLQWLKINNRDPKYTTLVDKYRVKEYVAEVIGSEYVIPTLGVWEKFEDIDFEALPQEFVLKCTHDSGGLVICTDKNKLDLKRAKKKITAALKRNYYFVGREWPYKDVHPRIIAEKYMKSADERTRNVDTQEKEELKDYKLMCFNGEVKCLFVCSERYSEEGLRVTFFDTEWNQLPFERHYKKSEKEIGKPNNLEKMIELAERLSKDMPFVRVDFYEIDDKIYFGELTFFPGSGFEEFNPEYYDKVLGEYIDISDVG